MLLLAVDTSGHQGGISLARGGAHQPQIEDFEIIESCSIQGGTFSAELIPQIAELLTKNGLTLRELEGLVAVTGPGSFTGLRVGLTAIKALAEVLKLPIAAVSSLELLAAGAESANTIMAVLDAGRDEVYAGIYERRGSALEKVQERLLPLHEAVELARSRMLPVVAVEIGLAAKFPTAEVVTYPGSEAAARCGLNKLRAGETVDVLALDANYVRDSRAEYSQKLKS